MSSNARAWGEWRAAIALLSGFTVCPPGSETTSAKSAAW